MPDFAYHAIDSDGREKRGRIAATNDDSARSALVKRKLYVVRVEAAEARRSAFAEIQMRRRRLEQQAINAVHAPTFLACAGQPT